MSKHNSKGRSKGVPHVRLNRSVFRSKAYLSLAPIARAMLWELIGLHNGRNNGKLWLSVRDAAALVGVSDREAASDALKALILALFFGAALLASAIGVTFDDLFRYGLPGLLVFGLLGRLIIEILKGLAKVRTEAKARKESNRQKAALAERRALFRTPAPNKAEKKAKRRQSDAVSLEGGFFPGAGIVAEETKYYQDGEIKLTPPPLRRS